MKALIIACMLLAGMVARAEDLDESHVIDLAWPAAGSVKSANREQISGVASSDDGDVFVLGRGENHWMPQTGFRRRKIMQDTVRVFGPGAGAPAGSWGRGLFIMPHQIVIDPAGHVWVVDAALHQVMKFSPAGKRLLVVGGPQVRFNMPTDIAFLSDGAFVVSDGYVNSRLVKFDAEGRPVAAWGTKGSAPLQFETPHSVAVDDQDRIYVADRENRRIQVLSPRGEFLATWTNVDRPITVRFAAGALFVLSNLEADEGVVRQLDRGGRVLGSFHTRPAGSTDDFAWPHGLAVSRDGNDVYVGFTLTGRRVHRYRRVAATR